MLQQNNIEISLHHSQTYHFGFPNGPFQLAKWHVLVTHWKSMLYRGGATDVIIWIILTTCYRRTFSMTLLNEKNYSIYTMACNEHRSEATNATIMPCQSKFKWRSRLDKQIVATSTASLSNGEKIAVRKCSEPEDDLLQIYDTLKVDHIPIKTRKFVWTQNADIKKNESWKSMG